MKYEVAEIKDELDNSRFVVFENEMAVFSSPSREIAGRYANKCNNLIKR